MKRRKALKLQLMHSSYNWQLFLYKSIRRDYIFNTAMQSMNKWHTGISPHKLPRGWKGRVGVGAMGTGALKFTKSLGWHSDDEI